LSQWRARWRSLKRWWKKWWRLEVNTLPWNRARIHYEFMRRGAFCRYPVHGNLIDAFKEGRIDIGRDVLFEPGVWIVAPGHGRIRIGRGTFLNLGVMVAAVEGVDIGEHCMFADGCVITDSDHRYSDPTMPVPQQGFTVKGPITIGDNTWCGANVVITSGVTIGERCVIGANSVVTEDIPAFSIAAGAPARVVNKIEYGE
jgi:acetyltransferase-like isoleucine patch superfamily enzyme